MLYSWACIKRTVVILIVLWLIGLLTLIIYNTGDFDSSDASGIDSAYHLPSYFAKTPKEYRDSVRGLNYKLSDVKHLPSEIIHSPAIFPLVNLLRNWLPDNTAADAWETSAAHPSTHSDGVVRRLSFLDENDMKIAQKYREMEIPFILYDVPELDAAAETWSVEYLLKSFGHFPRMTEKSSSNRFMYYSAALSADAAFKFPSWRPPQHDMPLTFSKFLRLAAEAELSHKSGSPLHYLTISAAEGLRTPWIVNSLPLFDPKRPENFFIVDPAGYRGINCRFGMRGVIAEAHFDSQRNFVSMLRGRKRYILLPPEECPKLRLLPRGHPSARHSDVDWSDLHAIEEAGFGNVKNATEAVISSGEILYIPSFWFHYIISQDASIQCNARSGSSRIGSDAILKCLNNKGRSKKEKSAMSDLLLMEMNI